MGKDGCRVMLTESAKRLKILRIELGMSQSEFADKFHFGVRGLQSWEQGRVEPPEHVMYLVPRVLSLERQVADLELALEWERARADGIE